MRALTWLLRGLVGGSLAWAAATKVRDPGAFLEALEGHPWFGPLLTQTIGVGVPAAELVVAAALLTGRWVEGAWQWAILLGVGFVGYVSSALALGLAMPCGCFGEERPLDGLTWWRAVLFLVVALVGLGAERWRRRRKGRASLI